MSLLATLRRRRRTAGVLTSLAAAAILLPTGAASASAVPAAAATAASAPAVAPSCSAPVKPTIVLVHGAWADSSSWTGVITRLTKAGYSNVVAAPNPLRGISADSAYLKDYLATITGPIVLVGHSYGGAVISNAATGNAQVKALVYDDAFIPDKGENIADLSSAQSALAIAQTNPFAVFKLVTYPGAPAGVYDSYLLPSVVFNSFAQDLPHAQAAVIAATQSPLSLIAFAEPSGDPAWKTIPSWDIVGRQDKMIPEAAQLKMANRAKSHITEINSSHVSLISHPDAVANVIIQAARATD